MGNNTSFVSAGAGVAIQIDNNGSVYGGSKLKGKVYLEVQKDTVSAESLNLRFFGEESTKVSYEVKVGSGDNERTETRYAYESCNIANVECVLHRYDNGQVMKGRYEYPFEVSIPQGLPGKQGEKSGSEYFCVDYHVEAKLTRQGMLKWDVKNMQEILMIDPPISPASLNTPLFVEPRTIPISFCCCVSTGTLALGAKLDSSAIFSDQKLNVYYVVQNESSCTIKALEVTINQYVSFRAQSHSESTSQALFSQRIPFWDLKGNVAPFSGKTRSREEAGLVSTDVMVDTLHKGLYSIEAHLPGITRPTYTGRLGSIRYEVQVQIKTPFCVDDPAVSIPVVGHRSNFSLTNAQPYVEQEFTKPDDWVAVVSPVIDLDPPPPPYPGPSAPTMVEELANNKIAVDSAASLIKQLTESNMWKESFILKEWLTYGDLQQLTPEVYGSIFQTIKGEHSYTMFPQTIGEALAIQERAIKAKHIAGAISAVPEAYKASVGTAFAPFCKDKENAKVEFEKTGLPQHSLSFVLIYYSQ